MHSEVPFGGESLATHGTRVRCQALYVSLPVLNQLGLGSVSPQASIALKPLPNIWQRKIVCIGVSNLVCLKVVTGHKLLVA